MEGRMQTMWMPLNNTAPIGIKAGTNRMIMKIVRSGGSFEFSCIIGSHKNKDHFLVNLSSLIKDASV